ncbi:MAG: DUF6443 domain-containing protein, partial [Bacteroidota bacterium]
MKYVDAFGRAQQTISIGAGPQNEDLVAFMDYDEFGRVPKAWLPYARPGQSGAFVPNPQAEQSNFYLSAPRVADSNFPFSETIFEPSPLNRTQEQGAAGQDWQIGNGHTVRTGYITNTAVHPVRKWEISSSNAHAPTLYPENELTGTHIQDEDQGEFFEFKDKLGHTIYKKVKNLDGKVDKGTGIQTEWLETYWVYDDFGNLAYVIPPLAMSKMNDNQSFDVNALNVDLIFEYRYDDRQRLVEKHVPDAGWEYHVYDDLDRTILRQTENLRAQNRWEFTQYDVHNRPVVLGLFENTSTVGRVSMQALVTSVLVNGNFSNPVRRASTSTGYTSDAFPNSNASSGYYEELVYRYYGHY